MLKKSKMYLLLIIFCVACKNNNNASLWAAKQACDVAWAANDTAFFINKIDSLKYLNFPKIMIEGYALSKVTGFGWCVWDFNNRVYQKNTENLNNIFKVNILNGFYEYKKSKMFMKKSGFIRVESYFNYDSINLMTSYQLSGLRGFLDCVADSILVIDYKKTKRYK